MRIEVEAAHVAGVETGLRTAQIGDRGPKPPVERANPPTAGRARRSAHWAGGESSPRRLGGAGKGLEAVQRKRRDEPIARVRQAHVAGHLGADGLRKVVVEDQPVNVAGEILRSCRPGVGIGRKVLASLGDHIHAALVNELVADRAGEQICRRAGQQPPAPGPPALLLDAAVEQRIPAHDQVVESRTSVAEVAIGRPAALAEELGADHHVHAAVDDPVNLLANDKALDRRVAEDGNQQPALAAVLVHRMAQVGQIKDGHASNSKQELEVEALPFPG